MKIGLPELALLLVIVVIALRPFLVKVWKVIKKKARKSLKKNGRELEAAGEEIGKTFKFLMIMVVVVIVLFSITVSWIMYR